LLSKNLKIKIYRTIIFPAVLYGCETWSLALGEDHRLRVFENGVLRIFGLKRGEVRREWRKLHNKELNDLNSLNTVRVIKSRIIKWAAHVARMGERRVVYRVLVGKPEERDNLGDPGVDERLILRWNFRKWDGGVWTGWSWLRIGTAGGHL
jgi:hypothetical protein